MNLSIWCVLREFNGVFTNVNLRKKCNAFLVVPSHARGNFDQGVGTQDVFELVFSINSSRAPLTECR